MEYKTLRKDSPDFQKYLLGTFSEELRALPVKTLNVNTESEEVTFKILSKNNIHKPKGLSFFFQVFKVYNLIYIVFPMVLVLVKNIVDQKTHNVERAALSALCILLGFIAANFRNDYLDHIKGLDRVQKDSGSRSIQKGWLTAHQTSHLSLIFLLTSLLFSIPLVWQEPTLIFFIVGGFLLIFWAQFSPKTSFKYQIGGEILIFLLLGPLLTGGYQISMGLPLDKEVLLLGGLWGWLLLFLIHIKNLTQILPLSQGKFSNTITWLGFDRSRLLIIFWWLSFIALYFLYHLKHSGFYWGWYLSIALLFFSVRFILKVLSLKSPLGSEILKMHNGGRRLFLITVSLWTLENLWYFFSWKI